MNIKDKLELINTPEDVFDAAKDLLENGHELVDTLSEYSPYLKVASKWMNKRRENKCKEFLQGLGMKVLSKEELTSNDLRKLDGLLKKNVNRLLVLDILEEATKTASDTSSKLLGIIAGQVMEEERQFNYNDWILINGLKNMNDWDLENLKKVYFHFETHPTEEVINTTSVYLNLTLKQVGETADDVVKNVKYKEEYKMLRSSLMRMSSLQVLSTGEMIFDDDGASFIWNKVGQEIYELINAINQG
ncbi:hypothetical protein [Bacillus toyonensis]|uniref:hypothetical protein n=1 Tax=Bacillus toyonensis TaxID=155322 RepID=UPI0011559AEA|nr:hypothetical protein [Bacillus toyonensis]